MSTQDDGVLYRVYKGVTVGGPRNGEVFMSRDSVLYLPVLVRASVWEPGEEPLLEDLTPTILHRYDFDVIGWRSRGGISCSYGVWWSEDIPEESRVHRLMAHYAQLLLTPTEDAESCR